jgi:hypothetical protein
VREVTGEDLWPAAAVPIKDGVGAGTHLMRGEETGSRGLMNGKERLGLVFFRAVNFRILKVYSLSWNGSALNVFNQTPTKVEWNGLILPNSGTKCHLN